MPQPPSPLWIIGIDGLEPQLLRRWCADGSLPVLARLQAGGVAGLLLSTPNQLTSAAWTTIATGAHPGAHGVYNFQERVPGEYRLRLPTANDRRLAAFWELASGAGLAVTTARVPMSYPVRPVNGLQVADWLAPSPHAEGFVYPETLRGELLRRFPRDYWLEPVDLARSSPQQALRRLLDSVGHTFALFRYLLAQRPADLFFGVVREADCAGHVFWDAHMAAGKEHSRGLASAGEDPLRAVYQRIDQELGELLEVMPRDADLVIVSDHGMGGHPQAPRVTAPLLEAAGLMVSRAPATSPRTGPWAAARRHLAQALPWGLRRRLRPLRPEDWAQGFTQGHLATIDFARSQAFSYLSAIMGEVWLNVRGRDPQGLVESGEEQAQLEADIQALFMHCRDAATGQPLVRNAWRRSDLFHGPHQGMLADLHIEFDLEVRPRSVNSVFRGCEVAVDLPGAGLRGGMHRPYGAFLACGPRIRERPRPVAGTLADVAPTALALLGLPQPEFMEGRILSEILAPAATGDGSQRNHAAGRRPAALYTHDELETIERRLSHLGYL